MMKSLFATALVLHSAAAGAQSVRKVAIECVGVTDVLQTSEKRPETRIYILNHKTQSVATWSASSAAEVAYCVNDCTTVYGASHIRLVDTDSSGSLILDIDRTTGAVMDLLRIGGSRMETFEGSCKPTAMPKPGKAAKF